MLDPVLRALGLAGLAALLSLVTGCGGGGGEQGPAPAESAAAGGPRAAVQALFTWTAAPDPRVKGYRLYYADKAFSDASQARLLGESADKSWRLKLQALNVPSGSKVYLAVAATDGLHESALSPPLAVVVP